MTIQRQYSLPNCKLVVDGLSDDARALGAARPPVSILVNAECQFIGLNQTLSGGREFLESLVAAVSDYAQECLSRVPHHKRHTTTGEMVQIERIEPDLHRLTLRKDASTPVDGPGVVQVDLKTVQLFDLVDAVDQFLADTQTLPDLSLKVAPISRRYAIAQESVTKRVVPAATGVASLAAAALALFFLPTPEVKRTEPPTPAQSTPASVEPTPVASVSPSPSASVEPSVSPTEAAESPDAESPEASPSPTTPPDETPSATATPDVDAVLSSADEITDLDRLETLNRELRSQISQAWERSPEPDENTIYRVVVAENGDIVGFKQTDDAAIAYTDDTPLLNLLKLGETPDTIAQFKVVFTPEGVVEVNPWRGWPKERNADSDE